MLPVEDLISHAKVDHMLDSRGRPNVPTVGDDICLHLPGLVVSSLQGVALLRPPPRV
jgi:hypothetical protein